MIFVTHFSPKNPIMTTVMTTQNIYLSSQTQQAYDLQCEHEYAYCDAYGRPYLNTLIPCILSYVYKTSKKKPTEQVSTEQICMLTNLSDRSSKCPMRFINDNKSWTESVDAYNNELDKIQRVADMSEFTEFNIKMDDLAKKDKDAIFMATIPRFSKAMLARMKKEKDELENKQPCADAKFYTWVKGNSASSTSRTAWGHRRSGGGKGKVSTLSDMNSEKAAAERAAARCVRQKQNKDKRESEAIKFTETMMRLKIQKEQNETRDTPLIEVVNEETEFQKFKREEIEAFTLKTISISNNINYIVDKPDTKNEQTGVKWTKVDVKQTTNDKIASNIANMMYSNSGRTTRVGALNRLAGMKNGTGEMRSRLCKSVIAGGNNKCPHGGRCKFAHGPDQLNLIGCVFGAKCNFVTKNGDVWGNTKQKICQFGHPGEEENKESFCRRIGMILCVPVITRRIVNIQTPIVAVARSVPIVTRYVPAAPTISYASMVKPTVCIEPKVFKIHKDRLEKTVAYIRSMKFTNVIIEFI